MTPAGDLDLAAYLRPGDTVVVGQALAEPPTLVEELIDAGRHVDDVTALCGYTLSDAWRTVTPGRPRILTYIVHGALRALRDASPGAVDVLPVHLSRMADHFATGRLAADVVLLQVGPPDERGDHDLGPTVDHVVVAAERARVVLVEVNEAMPRTRSRWRLPASRVTAALPSRRPLATSPLRAPTSVERRVAANIASVVPDGAVLQLGVSALAAACAQALHDRRGLRVRSGLVGDWLLDLHAAGALDDHPDSVVAGVAVGSPSLYAFLDGTDLAEFAPIAEQTAPGPAPFVSISSAVEVDLVGQLGAELAGGRYVGAVGGQVDFFRAAAHSAGGVAVVALASTSSSGASRIVPGIGGGLVTSSKSDVDVVVTEWGVADLRARSLADRVDALIGIAHPDHREALVAARPPWR